MLKFEESEPDWVQEAQFFRRLNPKEAQDQRGIRGRRVPVPFDSVLQLRSAADHNFGVEDPINPKPSQSIQVFSKKTV